MKVIVSKNVYKSLIKLSVTPIIISWKKNIKRLATENDNKKLNEKIELQMLSIKIINFFKLYFSGSKLNQCWKFNLL